jgi:hypothetical protein
VLNSECDFVVGGCGSTSPQLQWLRADLTAHRSARCTLSYFHHPRFSSGKIGSDPTMHEFWQALYDGGADVVISGHDHSYERFAPQSPSGVADAARGIREFVVGTGGAGFSGFTTVLPTSEVRQTGTYGILKLTLSATAYDWQFLPAPAPGGSFTDSGSGACH